MNYKTITFGTLTLVAMSACNVEKKAEQPNIILILADDMGWSDLGCYGGEIETPHLDSLAYNGIRFTQFYNTSKCNPSRGCLLTGLYAQQCGMSKHPGYLKNGATLAEVLKEAGYRTLMVGKHHGKDNPYDRGFDRYYGLRDGCCNFFNPGVQREGEGPPAHKTWAYPRTWCIDGQTIAPFTPVEKDFYTTDYFTNYALQYLETYKDEDRPFFLYMAYTAPHAPLHAWPEDIAKYKGKYSEGYAHYRKARYNKQKQMGLVDGRFPLSEPTYRDWDALSPEEQEKEALRMAVYAAMIDRMDQNIGKVIEKVEAMGELDNTLIMFCSDNGGSPGTLPDNLHGFNATADSGEIGTLTRWAYVGPSWANVSNTPFKYFKTWTHHGGTCTPLIAFWPAGIEGKNRMSEFPGHFIDFMPTLIDVAGAGYPDSINGERVLPMEGISFAPVFKNQAVDNKRAIFWQFSGGRGVRKDGWKLVSGERASASSCSVSRDTCGWALYHVRNDKTETNNLIDQKPEKAVRLKLLYHQWFNRMEGFMEE